MHVAEGKRIWNLNTPCVPEGTNEANVRKILLEEQGIEIAGGFGPLAGKVFRIGIMGPLATDQQRAHVPAAFWQCPQGKRLPEGESGRHLNRIGFPRKSPRQADVCRGFVFLPLARLPPSFFRYRR